MNKQIKSTFINSLFAVGLLGAFGCSEEEIVPEGLRQNVISNATSATPSVTFQSKKYIIISSGAKLPADIEGKVNASNGKLTALLTEVGLATATSDDPNFAAKAAKISGVRSVVNDFTYQGFDPLKDKAVEADNVNPASTGDSNPYFPFQWGHTAIQAPEAWNEGALGQGVRVAVLDGGFDLTHPDLQGNIVDARSFVPTEPAQFNRAGASHGSHTAGTIAAVDNNLGVIGVAPAAKLILVKVLADAGSGSFSWMMQGILYATQQKADVINMSLGAAIPRNSKYLYDNGTPENPADDYVVNETKAIQELVVAINRVTTYAAQQGVTIITSAGNDANNGNADQDLVHIPSDAPNVISISATGPTGWANAPLTTNLDEFASYSNFGTSVIDFAAPGGDFDYPTNELIAFRGITQYTWALDMVLSTSARGGYTWMAGTSMAAPHASGVAALIIGRNGGQMDPAKVEAVLRASSDDLDKPGRDMYYGNGRVNALRAIRAVQ
ncbi:S8 family peptidase [Rufibacter latericius]|uniref:Peptidase S8 and S53 subtilisin kexin sedolisin n=1 Tax=Rufibacter latericius TaxID=2487040 RepID=A0A3M9N1A8_9BACT|nr:S8 family serine peptidase [Rufibacter latericius]RNI31589.1 peptidase S8 and S53 subtilisin kexin sedolisin [Rufibacter latericius]